MPVLLAVLLCAVLARGEQPAVAPEEAIDEVVVTGEFPGPGMWRVRRADNPGHEMWIVGSHPPLPRKMKWKSREVESVALRSQEILLDSSVRMDPDEKIGVFRGLSLLPSALKARRNPGGTRLEEQLPPELYARWRVQKKRYIGNDSGIEQWRPLFAAEKLRREALDDLGLRESGMVWEVVEKLAKKYKIPVTTPSLRFKFHTDDLKAKIREFSRESLADTECFASTLDLVDALADGETQSRRATAWATADLETLERLPPLPNPQVPCAMAVLGSEVAKQILPADLREQLYVLWIDAAGKSLASNQTTLAIVPLSKLLREDGYLSRLRNQGFEIEPPK